jgi:hypothetical protein
MDANSYSVLPFISPNLFLTTRLDDPYHFEFYIMMQSEVVISHLSMVVMSE